MCVLLSLNAVTCTGIQGYLVLNSNNQQILLAGHECFHGGELCSKAIAIEYTYFEHYCHDALLHPVPQTFGNVR